MKDLKVRRSKDLRRQVWQWEDSSVESYPDTTREKIEISKRGAQARTSAKRGICFRIPTLYRCSKWQSVWNLKRMRANLHLNQVSHNPWKRCVTSVHAWDHRVKGKVSHLGVINHYLHPLWNYASLVYHSCPAPWCPTEQESFISCWNIIYVRKVENFDLCCSLEAFYYAWILQVSSLIATSHANIIMPIYFWKTFFLFIYFHVSLCNEYHYMRNISEIAFLSVELKVNFFFLRDKSINLDLVILKL